MGTLRNEYFKDYVVFDLETTGISVTNDDVVEISAVKVRDGKVVAEFSTLVNPGRPIPPMASAVNHITDDMVSNAPAFDVVLKDFFEFIGDDILVGHNIHTFDMKFIIRDTEKYFGKSIENDYVDTLIIARGGLTGIANNKLVTIAEHYGISSDGAHRALNDCIMNQQVYEIMGKELLNGKVFLNIKRCPECGDVLVKRNGKFGVFWGCSSFPKCKYTRND